MGVEGWVRGGEEDVGGFDVSVVEGLDGRGMEWEEGDGSLACARFLASPRRGLRRLPLRLFQLPFRGRFRPGLPPRTISKLHHETNTSANRPHNYKGTSTDSRSGTAFLSLWYSANKVLKSPCSHHSTYIRNFFAS